jgi:lysophospholipase L1-like esterase
MFTRLIPRLPPWARDRPIWKLRTSSLGIRNDEVDPAKPSGSFRVIVLGDSWTVGVNLDVEQTTVRRLGAMLAAAAPGARVEVINYGLIGGKAETGRRLVPRILGLHPDLVVVAYAQNDESAVRTGETPAAVDEWSLPLRARLSLLWSRALDHVETYKLLVYLRTRRTGAIEESLRRSATVSTRAGDNQRGGCPNPRAFRTPYHDAIDQIVTAALAAQVDVVLLYDNLPDAPSHCTLVALSTIARAHDVPLVDASSLLAVARARLQADAERQRGLAPAPEEKLGAPGRITLVLRVDMAGEHGRPRVMGNLPSLGRLQPNVVALHDDGTHGDQRAGDGVWSLGVDVPQPARVVYLYTNGDVPGTWTGLEDYQPRVFALTARDRGRVVYAPIARFGRVLLCSDPAHPDAAGAELISQELARVVRARPVWDAFVRSQPAAALR